MADIDQSSHVRISIELTRCEAWEFAQFLKRVGHADYQALCEPYNHDGPSRMIDAGEKIRAALAEQGYAPR
ncbi:MAG: DUF7706 family protein [Acidobacteriaceae bacterium]